MTSMPHVSETLAELRRDLAACRDSEVQELAFVLPQYIVDHHDRAAFRDVDRQVNAFARAIDRMLARLEKWEAEACRIERSVEGFYGE